jgi:hypothetical protein
VSKKNNKQEALERAQKYAFGSKLEKSEVKKLEDKGFSASQIQAVAGSMKVGDKAQSYMDRSSGGSSGVGGKIYTVGGDARVRVNSRGQAIVPGGAPVDRYALASSDGSPVIPLTQKQADKINRKVKKAGGSLTGGEGMAVSRFITIKDPGFYTARVPWSGAPSRVGEGKQQLAIYAPIGNPSGKKNEGKGSGKDSRGTGGSGGTRSAGAPSAAATAYQRAQDHISGRTPQGEPPEMFPRGIRPGRAVEGVANYADRLGVFNANYTGWMHDRAEADRLQSGASLLQFADITPKAPDVPNAKDMIEMANLMNKKIQID